MIIQLKKEGRKTEGWILKSFDSWNKWHFLLRLGFRDAARNRLILFDKHYYF